MAIKIGNTDISSFKVGSDDCKVYLGDTLLYPTTPSFDGKWLATYSDSHTESAACDSTSAITDGEIEKTNLVDVQIGQCVTSIGMSAFGYCSDMTTCTIGSGVTSIGDSVFRYCFGLASITSLATTPPLLGIGVFTGTPIALGTGYIYVPSSSLNSYKQASGWSDFSSQILPIPNS